MKNNPYGYEKDSNAHNNPIVLIRVEFLTQISTTFESFHFKTRIALNWRPRNFFLFSY